MDTTTPSRFLSRRIPPLAIVDPVAREFSPYQQAIFTKIKDPRGGSLLIEAVAGSGKTTTIVEALKLLPNHLRILFLAFNKSIANELRDRVPAHVFAKTFHSQCLYAYQKWLGRKIEDPDNSKVSRIVKTLLTQDSKPKGEWERYRGFVQKLVGYAKGVGMGYCVPNQDASWLAIIEHHDMSLDSTEATVANAIKYAKQVLARNNEILDVIDYDDMLYLTLINDVTFFPQDFVFVDEVQDLNSVQRVLLKRMLRRGSGRLIAVGDSAQAIYGFRGADSDGMAILAREFNCTKMPLTVSYRCPKAVVAEARKYVPHIEPSPTAADGLVEPMWEYTPENFTQRDAILCRNSAPLVAFAYGLLHRSIPCRIMGREIGQGLIDLVRKMRVDSLKDLQETLEEYRQRETSALIAKEQEQKAEAVNDKVACIQLFIEQLPEGKRTVDALVEKIGSLFSDDPKADVLTLATVHKSKGMEWGRVFILDFEKYMPSRYAKQEWQKTQERNLQYVAVTRAKMELIFIESEAWKKFGVEPVKPVTPAETITLEKADARANDVAGNLAYMDGLKSATPTIPAATPTIPAALAAEMAEDRAKFADEVGENGQEPPDSVGGTLVLMNRLQAHAASMARTSAEATWRPEALNSALDEAQALIDRLRALTK